MTTRSDKFNRGQGWPKYARLTALWSLSLMAPWFFPLLSCGMSDTNTHTYCSDQDYSVTLITDVADLSLIDDNDIAVAVTDNLLTVTHGENDSIYDVTVTLSWDEGGELSVITVTDCYALDDSCMTLSPGALVGAQVRSGVDNDDGSVDYPVTVTYDTTAGAARRLAATITTVSETVTADRNDYTCEENCSNSAFGFAECPDSDTDCDYTCDNGATGSYSYSPGCDGSVSGGLLSDGGDCTVLDLVYPDFPETFTAAFE